MINVKTEKGDSYITLTEDGNIDTIHGNKVPEGVIAAAGYLAVPEDSREISIRSIQMSKGFFDFAEKVYQHESTEGDD